MMTDTARYRNVSLKHDTYSKVQRLSRQLIPQTNLSVAKTIEVIINKSVEDQNVKIGLANS